MIRRRTVFLSILTIVVVLGAAAFLVPLSAFRAPLEAAASRALDREVQIGGSLHLAVYPQLGISLKDVSIANIKGGQEPQMITVGKIVVGAELMPLLTGQLRVTKVVLKEPVIHLEIGNDGVGNWQKAGATPPPSPSEAASLSLERVKIEDGTITYFDARTGKTDTLSAVSVALTTGNTSADLRPLSLQGTMIYRSVPVTFDAKLDDLDALLKGEPGNADFGVNSELVNAAFIGRLQIPGSLSGNLTLNTRSLRELTAWTGQQLPPGNGFGAATIESAIAAKDGVLTLSKAAISFDGMKLNGEVSLDTKPSSPTLKGALAIDHLNAIPYLAPGASRDVTSAAANASPDTPLAFNQLKGVDADLSLTIGALTLPDIKLDKVALTAALHGGVLKADFSNIAAYGGSGKGTATVDATAAVPTFRSVVDMSGVKTELLFAQMAGAPKISSSGSVRLDVTSRGDSETAIIKALSGKLSVSFGAGTISGVDLGALARLLQSTANLLNGALGESARTEFSSLAASFSVQNGVAHTNDFRMTGSRLAMTGAGTVNLASHQIDFHLDPTAKVGVAGIHVADVGIPFYVRGNWSNPSYEPDPAGLAKGVVGTVTGTATQILSVPGGALKSLFGGN
jgi:AsmA protein